MSRRVRIAMLDSGVFIGNPHIRRRLEGGITILPEGERQGFEDTLGHGTAVCAVLQEWAPDAALYAVKIFDKKLATSLSIVLRAMEWCVKQEIDLINLSLGTTNEEHIPHFLSAIARVHEANGVLVSACEVNGTSMLPGSLPGVVAVAEDAECPREAYRVLHDGTARVAACPFPLDIAGVPRERNLRGVSFSVAHVSAQLGRTWHRVPPGADTTARVREAAQLVGSLA